MNKIVLPQGAGSFAFAPSSDDVLSPGANSAEPIVMHYARIAYKYRRMIASIIIACVALALIATTLIQRQYTATTRIQIARIAAKIVDIEGVEDQAGRDFEFYETQYRLLESRSLAETVVKKLRLAENDKFIAGFRGEVAELASLSDKERRNAAVEIVRANVSIAPVTGSSIVDIRYTSPEPQMASAIANAFAEAFIETNLARRYDASSYARDFLRDRLETVRRKLEASERQAAEFASTSGLVKVASGGDGKGALDTADTLAATQLSQLSSQLSEARAKRVRAEADFRANGGGSAAAKGLENSAINALRQQRATLIGELGKLQADFGPEYPRVVALKSQIAEIDGQISREQGRVSTSISQQYADLYRQAAEAEAGLQAKVNELTSKVVTQQRSNIGLGIIMRDVDTNRALYDALLQRYKEIGVAGGVGTNNVSIVDPAIVPTSPSSPNLPLNVALGLIFGLMTAFGAVFLREHLADGIVAPNEFQQRLGIPLLGSVPLASNVTEIDQLGSPVSEAYFSILTALKFSTAEGLPKTMMVTSTKPNEGKSTTALAIAHDIARVGKKTLLIDADMRNPSVHRRLGLENESGLSDLAIGDAKREAIVEVSPNIFVLTSGSRVPNPPELISGEPFARTLRDLGKEFDHVVIDSPPILGLADAPSLSRMVDATIFVLEFGNTKASQANLALDRLRAVDARVVGAVLTKLNASAVGYGYGYGYDYKYGN